MCNMKENKVKVHVTVPAHIERELRDLAKRESRSFSNAVALVLEKGLKETKAA